MTMDFLCSFLRLFSCISNTWRNVFFSPITTNITHAPVWILVSNELLDIVINNFWCYNFILMNNFNNFFFKKRNCTHDFLLGQLFSEFGLWVFWNTSSRYLGNISVTLINFLHLIFLLDTFPWPFCERLIILGLTISCRDWHIAYYYFLSRIQNLLWTSLVAKKFLSSRHLNSSWQQYPDFNVFRLSYSERSFMILKMLC